MTVHVIRSMRKSFNQIALTSERSFPARTQCHWNVVFSEAYGRLGRYELQKRLRVNPSGRSAGSPSWSMCAFRRGASNPIVVGLLAAILLALVTLLVVVIVGGRNNGFSNGGNNGRGAAVQPGQKLGRDGLPKRDPMLPVDDPDRIKSTLQQGKTYSAVIKAGFDARVEDKDWGVRTVISLAYLAEMEIERKIEQNDGKRIIELRTYKTCRNAKLLSKAESVSIELGIPGALLLGALEFVQPGAGAALIEAKPFAEELARQGVDITWRDQTVKVFGFVDGLSGKQVRITFVDDGKGVESIEPIGCSLSVDERDFVASTAVLSDCYLLPDLKLKPGSTWTVDGRQIGNLIDPTLRATPAGQITIERLPDQSNNGKQFAELRVQSGTVELNGSNVSARRVGRFTPRGMLQFNLTDGYINRADLDGNIYIESVSQDHILFEASFKTQPRLKASYTCEMR